MKYFLFTILLLPVLLHAQECTSTFNALTVQYSWPSGLSAEIGTIDPDGWGLSLGAGYQTGRFLQKQVQETPGSFFITLRAQKRLAEHFYVTAMPVAIFENTLRVDLAPGLRVQGPVGRWYGGCADLGYLIFTRQPFASAGVTINLSVTARGNRRKVY